MMPNFHDLHYYSSKDRLSIQKIKFSGKKLGDNQYKSRVNLQLDI